MPTILTLSGFLKNFGFGKRYAQGTGKTRYGPIPPDPDAEARYFQPLPVERSDKELTEFEIRRKRLNRLEQPVWRRKFQASTWVWGRKFSRLHRAVPVSWVAVFYLFLAGSLCYVVARPLLTPPTLPKNPPPIAVRPGNPDQIFARIFELISQKDYSEALALADTLPPEARNDTRFHLAQGTIAAAQRDYPTAHAAFLKAQELSPGSVPILLNIAEIEFVMEQFESAAERYRKVNLAQPRSPLPVFRLYLCALMQGQPEEANRLRQNPAIESQSLEWLYMQAADDLHADRTEQGHKMIERAHVLYGKHADPYDKTFVRLGLLPSPDAP